MKRFYWQNTTDEGNGESNATLVSLTQAEVLAQGATPPNGRRIPIDFLNASEEEQSIRIQSGVIEPRWEPFKKNELQPRNRLLLVCP